MVSRLDTDLFGAALLDVENGRHGRLLSIRRDDDHVDTHDPALYFAPAPFPHETDLLALSEGPILDVGCGAGRTVLWLEKQGFAVTGIDLSPGAIDVCNRRGCKDVRLINIMDQDAANLENREFRTAILFGNNVGIGGTVEGATDLLQKLRDKVVPGGLLLITGLDIARTDDPGHLAYHARNVTNGRPIGEIQMRFEYGDTVGQWVPWFHPTPAELTEIAKQAGWHMSSLNVSDGPFYATVLRSPE